MAKCLFTMLPDSWDFHLQINYNGVGWGGGRVLEGEREGGGRKERQGQKGGGGEREKEH